MQRWIFVCLHGAAKSVMAAAYCRRLAAERGMSLEVASGGIEPDAQIPPGVVASLLADGIEVGDQVPRRVRPEDLAAATRVIAFGCDLGGVAPPGLPIEQWEGVPPASEDFGGARAAILARLETLFGTGRSIRLRGYVSLPAHVGRGGFDHAAVHRPCGRLYVAHTVNDALDVIDCRTGEFRHSIPDLPGVAGVLVCEEQDLLFTSNRRANTVGLFSAPEERLLGTVRAGLGPNGLAYDPSRRQLLAANVGDEAVPGSHTVSIVDVRARALVGAVPVSGRTRWALFDAESDAFYVNIAKPSEIAVIEGRQPDRVRRTIPIPAAGPHGLDLDPRRRRLFCACDAKALIALDPVTGRLAGQSPLCGVPDVVFCNTALGHVYVAIGDPGVIEVFEAETLRRIEMVETEAGAHTIAFDAGHHTVYAFLPGSHRAAVYLDRDEETSTRLPR